MRPGGRAPIHKPSEAHRQAATSRPPAESLVRAAEAELIVGFQRARYDGTAADVDAAASVLLQANTSLIRRGVPRRRSNPRLDTTELEQAATVGLFVAAARFRAAEDASFPSYAHHWIRKEVQRAIATGAYAIAIPANRTGLVRVAAAKLTDDPLLNDDQLASELSITSAVARGLRTVVTTAPIKYHDPPIDDSCDPIVDRLGVSSAVANLDDGLRAVVLLRHGFDGQPPRSHREIGRILGVSDFTVRSRLRKAHQYLRRLLS